MEATMTRKREAVRHHVEIEFGGEVYKGAYTAARGLVNVYSEFGQKSAKIGALPEDFLAKTLLKEFVEEQLAAK
jgi:hypothetical protein